jgi:hypothetical protein
MMGGAMPAPFSFPVARSLAHPSLAPRAPDFRRFDVSVGVNFSFQVFSH